MPKPRLRVVDSKTGELHETCPTCAEWQKKYNGVLSQLGIMRRDLEGRAQDHHLFPDAKKLFDLWRERCKHPRSKFTADRFDQILPHLRDEDFGYEMCQRAIEGAAYDPNTGIRRNGSVVRYDDWELIFRNRGKAEDFANRAPYHLPDPEHIKTLANALAFLDKHKPFGECVEEARRRLT
jgi:hypothetical protein